MLTAHGEFSVTTVSPPGNLRGHLRESRPSNPAAGYHPRPDLR